MSKMAPVPERSMSWWSEGLGAAGHSSRTNELRLADAASFIGSRLRFLFRILLRSHLCSLLHGLSLIGVVWETL